MSIVNKPEIDWKNVEAGLGAIAFGLILFVIGWQSAILSIFAGFLTILGGGYLASVPEVRFYFKLVINRVSRKQVFKNTGTISGSNVVGPVDTGGAPLTISQTAGQPKAPFLRAVPVLTYMPMGDQQFLELAVDITNIGDGIATDIEGKSILKGPEALALPNSGVLQIHPLGPGETKRVRIVVDDAVKITRQFYNVTIQYRDTNRKDVQSTGTEGLVKDLKLDNFLQGLGFEKRIG